MTIISRTDIMDIDRSFPGVEHQAAQALGATIANATWKGITTLGSSHAYTDVFRVHGGGFVVISADDNLMQAALVSGDHPCKSDFTNEAAQYRLFTDAAGITACEDLAYERWIESLDPFDRNAAA